MVQSSSKSQRPHEHPREAYWDDHTRYGSRQFFTLHYYLADDSVEILETKQRSHVKHMYSIYIYIYIYTHVISISLSLSIYIYIDLSIYVCMCVYICVYIYIYVCICICIYIYIYIYIYEPDVLAA